MAAARRRRGRGDADSGSPSNGAAAVPADTFSRPARRRGRTSGTPAAAVGVPGSDARGALRPRGQAAVSAMAQLSRHFRTRRDLSQPPQPAVASRARGVASSSVSTIVSSRWTRPTRVGRTPATGAPTTRHHLGLAAENCTIVYYKLTAT